MNATAPHPVSKVRTAARRAWRVSRGLCIALIAIVVVLIGVRIALPEILRSAINRRLARIPDYRGHVAAVDLAVWRGAYVLRDITVVKTDGHLSEPYFSAAKIDFSLAWRELLHRKIVSDIYVERARLNFVKAPTPQASQLAVDRRWQQVIQDIFPIEIAFFEIVDSQLHYRDSTHTPALNVFVDNLHAVATGLRNRPEETREEFPARLSLEGQTVGKGRLLIAGQGEPLAEKYHFELRVTLQDVALPALNDLLRAYAGVDVAAGNFQLYFEMAAKDGRFQGYAKPFFSHMDFAIAKDPNKNIFEKAWTAVVNGLVTLLKNRDHDQLAMRVPFAGEFGQTQVGVWATITSMLRNGFIEALPAVLEHSVKSAAIPPANKPVNLPPEPAQVPVPSKAESETKNPPKP